MGEHARCVCVLCVGVHECVSVSGSEHVPSTLVPVNCSLLGSLLSRAGV